MTSDRVGRGSGLHNNHPIIKKSQPSFHSRGHGEDGKILKKKDVLTFSKPLETIKQKMRSMKDTTPHRQYKDIYKVACSCGKRYIAETQRLFHVRIKEHSADIRNEHICTSTLAKYSLKTKHHMCLEDTKILAREEHYHKHWLREALEIIKHPNNLNRDRDFVISESWVPLINQQKNNPIRPTTSLKPTSFQD